MKYLSMFFALALVGFAKADDNSIEFTGAQCVDTGYYVTGETAIVADFRLLDTETAQQLVWSAGTKMWSRFYVSGEKKWSWSCCNWGNDDKSKDAKYDNASTGVAVDGDRLVATVDGYGNHVVLEKNGTVLHERTAEWTGWVDYPHTETSSESLKIGCRFAENRFYAKMKLYSFKIYEQGELVRDYIPATREGIVGLYDKKNGGFIFDTRYPVGSGDHKLVANGDLPAYEGTDAYVESDGTSAMNARIRATADVCVEVDFAFMDTETTQQRIVGADGRPCFYIDGTNTFTFACGANAAITPTAQVADKYRHTVVIDYQNKKMALYSGPTLNFSQNISATPLVSETPMPFALFGNMNAASGTYDDGFKFRHLAKAKIYGAKFYHAGELVHDYRPCVKGGVVGFKDAVGGDFISGENPAAFTAGGDVEEIADDPYVQLTGNNAKVGANNVIDTGYYPGPTTKIELDYAFADNYASGTWFLMAAWTPAVGGADAERLNFAANTTSALQWRNGTGMDWKSVSTKLASATTQKNVRRKLKYDATKGSVTLSTYGFDNVTTSSAATLTRKMTDKTLRLGGDTSATITDFAPLKIYGLKIYEGEELVHDFIPYVKDGLIGLYDATTRAFKPNAAANGEFAIDAGGTITGSEGFDDVYITFSGAQSIDTGFKPTTKTRIVADLQPTSTAVSPQQFFWSSNNEMCQRLYTTNTGKLGWFAGWNAGSEGAVESVNVDVKRLKADIDSVTMRGVLTRGDETLSNKTATKTTRSGSCATTLKIGSRFAANGTTWNYASMRLYSFKIYEDGALVRDYVPYVKDGEVGLWDKVNGTFAGNTQSGAPLAIGMGKGSFVETLGNVNLAYGKSTTLSAKASGAISYQWFKNDEKIDGATGPTYTVDWRKGKPNTDTFSVVAYFDVFGVKTASEPEIATVTYRPAGLCVIMR